MTDLAQALILEALTLSLVERAETAAELLASICVHLRPSADKTSSADDAD
jgi:hypothetical protein